MKELRDNELLYINGGEIDVDINELVDQLNPLNVFYDFGYNVLYPYVWKPITNLF